MTQRIQIVIDDREIEARPGATILAAADEAGVYVPRLCHLASLSPHGSCRVCTVFANGRPQAACTTPVAPGMVVENDTERLRALRRDLIDMLFVSGNHFCMFCEKSGNCELQALAYRFGITAPSHPYLFPEREVDATHEDVLLDRNRCIVCTRCVRSSVELDGKHELGVTGRGFERRIEADHRLGLSGTHLQVTDEAVRNCPTGSLLAKRVGYRVPIGQRLYDHEAIGSDVERRVQSPEEVTS